ncbi:MAG TPA: L-2-hydroxyglutarate oxidase [Gaiellales bacterium]|nr:L-2-hydroxyglutarate oxidase [Gaiellales bacterium]
MSEPRGECDLVVVGAGIIGLATARELLRRHPDMALQVLEREPAVAAHQTGHNSGVIHQGVYYQPGSLKARLCVAGARELYDYCDARGIPAERCGKLIVATDAGELSRLDELERRGVANGVPGLRRVDAEELRQIEPHASGIAALHSPQTGIVDYARVAAAFADDVSAAGGTISTGCGVTGIEPANGRIRIVHERGETRARHAVFCAGAWSDRLAVMAGGDADPRIVPFRGAYRVLRPERRSLVRGMIYPVPDPELPFLGVHLTRRIDGEVLIGPSALLAGARDGYALGRVVPDDIRSTLTWPGSYRMAWRFWRTGIDELRHVLPGGTFVAAAARYVPELRDGDVTGGFAGVRAQAVGRDGRLVDDFVFSHTERALHVRNAPSPGATSSLAIARHIADEAARSFDLPATTAS